MELNFTPELEKKLDRIAGANRSAVVDYVRQLVETYVDHDAWFREKVTASLEKLDRGESLSHEQMGAQLEKMFES